MSKPYAIINTYVMPSDECDNFMKQMGDLKTEFVADGVGLTDPKNPLGFSPVITGILVREVLKEEAEIYDDAMGCHEPLSDRRRGYFRDQPLRR